MDYEFNVVIAYNFTTVHYKLYTILLVFIKNEGLWKFAPPLKIDITTTAPIGNIYKLKLRKKLRFAQREL